jgi:CubicO group peptidase (beta-lactamase class C family)
MRQFMEANGVRTAQLAIAKNGVMKFARAYTWAEQGYKVTQPGDVFLLASLSKIFTAAAIQSLFDKKQLTAATTVYPLLGFSHPADFRSDSITIQQLIDHTAGYDDTATGSSFDPTYSMRQIGLAQSPRHVANKLDIARFMYARALDFAPGSNYKYSNYGYLLLSAVIEHVTGLGFFDYLSKAILQPEEITQVLLSSTVAAQRAANQAIAEDGGFGQSPLDLQSASLVPAVYGGDSEIKEVAAGCAGLAASAAALAKFIYTHAVWGIGGRAPGAARSGSTPGASTWAKSRTDGIDYALVVNTRDFPPQAPAPSLNNLFGTLIDHLLDTTPLP